MVVQYRLVVKYSFACGAKSTEKICVKIKDSNSNYPKHFDTILPGDHLPELDT